ncbi:MAG: UDP-N-acetylglucosamine 1-carboxyvinyltransferase [Clostridia bacterium]|nr:UDP-N-acetylglucosamine 1-carboxyvinyltransferase [Clostridia bacterium]
MQADEIIGPTRLFGNVTIHGAKNSALPILAATVLCRGRCILRNVPEIEDVSAACRILQHLGAELSRQRDALSIDTSHLVNRSIDSCLAGKMRASILFLGALMGRFGEVTIALPGGCPIGRRPVDLHLCALERLGAQIEEQEEMLHLRCETPRTGMIRLPVPSVGATENVLLAGACMECETVLEGAAREPEICDLADFLQKAGAVIRGAGTDRISIIGCRDLAGTAHTVISDRIETATYLCAAAGCGGEVTLHHTDGSLLIPVLQTLEQAGCRIERKSDSLKICTSGRLTMPSVIVTRPYPGFPTDAQPLMMAAFLRAEGACRFYETIFEHRFCHAGQMKKLGGKLTEDPESVYLRGTDMLTGSNVRAQDLRGGAALAIACMQAEGKSVLTGVKHMDRGYDNLEKNLKNLGAKIKRVEISP